MKPMPLVIFLSAVSLPAQVQSYKPVTAEMLLNPGGIAAGRLNAAASLALRIVGLLTHQLSGALRNDAGPGTSFGLNFPKRQP